MICLHLRSGKVIKSTPEHTHFAGYVLGETPQTYFLYLMHKAGYWLSPGHLAGIHGRSGQAHGGV